MKDSAAVIWFTGLSGAGKTTLGRYVESRLVDQGLKVEHLDGDTIRDIFPDTGFSPDERNRHIERVGYLASRLERHGISVIGTFISPYRSSRGFVRSLCKNFIEVYLSTPLDECEKRDPKGLYAQARKGGLKNFTGLDAPYETPEKPELILDTSRKSIEEAGEEILNYLRKVRLLKA